MNEEKILLDILRGYSKIKHDGSTFYFKHPTLIKKLEETFVNKSLEKRAKSLDLLYEEDIIKEAIDNGHWSEDQEKEMEDLRFDIKGRIKANEKISEPSIKKSNEESIERLRSELREIENKRFSITKFSIENYVKVQAPLFFCRNDVFLDKEFTKNIDEYTSTKIFQKYILLYNDFLDQELLIKSSFHNMFFDAFMTFNEDSHSIFGKNIYDLTYFQKSLVIYAKILKSKILNIPDIPDSVKNDPIKLYNYERKDSSQKSKGDDFKIRKFAQKCGGTDNIKPEDKLT